MKKEKKEGGGIFRIQWFAELAAWVVLVLTLLVACFAMTVGLDKPMLGPHSFRQTQTAISVEAMVGKPWVFFDYETPVLGKPWQIPMEVPFYQWVVARVVEIFRVEVDQAGQVVAAGFWLLCLWPIGLIASSLGIPRPVTCLTVSICLAAPVYLFWGRSFMIETAGLFFGLGTVAAGLRAADGRSVRWLVTCLVLGVLAALCKATTWAVASGVGILLVGLRGGLLRRDLLVWKGVVLLVLATPYLAGRVWLEWGDKVKAKNPFAREILMAGSANQVAWNFGTLEQRLDWRTWAQIFEHFLGNLYVPVPILGYLVLPLVLVAGCVLRPGRMGEIVALVAGFLAGPLIFTNLYFQHSYYWCANSVWLFLAVGLGLAGIWEYEGKVWARVLAVGLGVLMVLGGFLEWRKNFLPIFEKLPSREQLARAWTHAVQRVVPPWRTVLVLGNDWNPNSLYYAKRRGIAFPTYRTIPFPGPQLEESLKLLGEEEALGGVVVNEQLLQGEQAVIIRDWLEVKGFDLEGTRTAFGVLFSKSDRGVGSP